MGQNNVELRSKPKDSSEKITLTLVETQQLPDLEKEKYASTLKLMQTIEPCRIPLSKQNGTQKYWNGVKIDWIRKASC